MEAPRILVIEDDKDLHYIYKKAINPLVETVFCDNLRDGFKLIKTGEFDLILLDIHLGIDNSLDLMEYENELTNNNDDSFIGKTILITGINKIDLEIRGHTIGVKDYVKKPLNVKLLNAIVNKHLQEELNKTEEIITKGPFLVDKFKHEISIISAIDKSRNVMNLTALEYRFLKFFIMRAGQIISRNQLAETVWEDVEKTNSRAIDMHISCLRKKMGKYSGCLKTKRSFGYILEI